LGFHYSGGSDAHAIDEMGKCITVFDKMISDESGLLAELKAGRFTGMANNHRK